MKIFQSLSTKSQKKLKNDNFVNIIVKKQYFFSLLYKKTIRKLFVDIRRQRTRDFRYKYFLNTVQKSVELEDKNLKSYIFKLKNCLLFKSYKDDKRTKKWLFGLKIFDKDSAFLLSKKYAFLAKEEQKLLIFINTNLGELFCFLRFFYQPFLKGLGYERAYFVLSKRYHFELFKIFGIKDYYYDKKFYIPKPSMSYKNTSFFLLFPNSYFAVTESKMRAREHYLKSLASYVKIDLKDALLLDWQKDEKKLSKLIKKLEKIKLNINNFYFLSPLANSMKPANELFEKLIKSISLQAADVFINLSAKESFKSEYAYKSLDLSLEEALYLASLSRAVIALRSGFIELLSLSEKNLFIIYTSVYRDDISSQELKQGYTLKNFPLINKELIHEYYINEMSETKLLKDIENKLKAL